MWFYSPDVGFLWGRELIYVGAVQVLNTRQFVVVIKMCSAALLYNILISVWQKVAFFFCLSVIFLPQMFHWTALITS
jgi:hypothetical protein